DLLTSSRGATGPAGGNVLRDAFQQGRYRREQSAATMPVEPGDPMPVEPESIVPRAVGGDRAALESLLERFAQQSAAGLAQRIEPAWRGVLEVDDVLQVTFLEAFLSVERCQARGATRPRRRW